MDKINSNFVAYLLTIKLYTMSKENIEFSDAKALGLNEEEFEKIKQLLGRTPNYTELSIYSVMWSEHASYKNSIRWIKTLPRKGGCLLVLVKKTQVWLI